MDDTLREWAFRLLMAAYAALTIAAVVAVAVRG